MSRRTPALQRLAPRWPLLCVLSVLHLGAGAPATAETAGTVERACGPEPSALCLNNYAESLLESLPAGPARKTQLALVAVAYAEAGQRERALALAGRIGDVTTLDDPYTKANLLGDLSVLQAFRGNEAESAELGRLASRETLNVLDDLARAELLYAIAQGQVSAGHHHQAGLLADSLGGVVRYLPQPEARLLVSGTQAMLYARLGNAEAVRSLLDNVREELPRMQMPIAKVGAYAYMGTAAILAGETGAGEAMLEQAEAVADGIEDARWRLTALCILLDAQNDLDEIRAQPELVGRMLSLTDEVDEPRSRIWALTIAATSIGRLGR